MSAFRLQLEHIANGPMYKWAHFSDDELAGVLKDKLSKEFQSLPTPQDKPSIVYMDTARDIIRVKVGQTETPFYIPGVSKMDRAQLHSIMSYSYVPSDNFNIDVDSICIAQLRAEFDMVAEALHLPSTAHLAEFCPSDRIKRNMLYSMSLPLVWEARDSIRPAVCYMMMTTRGSSHSAFIETCEHVHFYTPEADIRSMMMYVGDLESTGARSTNTVSPEYQKLLDEADAMLKTIRGIEPPQASDIDHETSLAKRARTEEKEKEEVVKEEVEKEEVGIAPSEDAQRLPDKRPASPDVVRPASPDVVRPSKIRRFFTAVVSASTYKIWGLRKPASPPSSPPLASLVPIEEDTETKIVTDNQAKFSIEVLRGATEAPTRKIVFKALLHRYSELTSNKEVQRTPFDEKIVRTMTSKQLDDRDAEIDWLIANCYVDDIVGALDAYCGGGALVDKNAIQLLQKRFQPSSIGESDNVPDYMAKDWDVWVQTACSWDNIKESIIASDCSPDILSSLRKIFPNDAWPGGILTNYMLTHLAKLENVDSKLDNVVKSVIADLRKEIDKQTVERVLSTKAGWWGQSGNLELIWDKLESVASQWIPIVFETYITWNMYSVSPYLLVARTVADLLITFLPLDKSPQLKSVIKSAIEAITTAVTFGSVDWRYGISATIPTIAKLAAAALPEDWKPGIAGAGALASLAFSVEMMKTHWGTILDMKDTRALIAGREVMKRLSESWGIAVDTDSYSREYEKCKWVIDKIPREKLYSADFLKTHNSPNRILHVFSQIFLSRFCASSEPFNLLPEYNVELKRSDDKFNETQLTELVNAHMLSDPFEEGLDKKNIGYAAAMQLLIDITYNENKLPGKPPTYKTMVAFRNASIEWKYRAKTSFDMFTQAAAVFSGLANASSKQGLLIVGAAVAASIYRVWNRPMTKERKDMIKWYKPSVARTVYAFQIFALAHYASGVYLENTSADDLVKSSRLIQFLAADEIFKETSKYKKHLVAIGVLWAGFMGGTRRTILDTLGWLFSSFGEAESVKLIGAKATDENEATVLAMCFGSGLAYNAFAATQIPILERRIKTETSEVSDAPLLTPDQAQNKVKLNALKNTADKASMDDATLYKYMKNVLELAQIQSKSASTNDYNKQFGALYEKIRETFKNKLPILRANEADIATATLKREIAKQVFTRTEDVVGDSNFWDKFDKQLDDDQEISRETKATVKDTISSHITLRKSIQDNDSAAVVEEKTKLVISGEIAVIAKVANLLPTGRLKTELEMHYNETAPIVADTADQLNMTVVDIALSFSSPGNTSVTNIIEKQAVKQQEKTSADLIDVKTADRLALAFSIDDVERLPPLQQRMLKHTITNRFNREPDAFKQIFLQVLCGEITSDDDRLNSLRLAIISTRWPGHRNLYISRAVLDKWGIK